MRIASVLLALCATASGLRVPVAGTRHAVAVAAPARAPVVVNMALEEPRKGLWGPKDREPPVCC